MPRAARLSKEPELVDSGWVVSVVERIEPDRRKIADEIGNLKRMLVSLNDAILKSNAEYQQHLKLYETTKNRPQGPAVTYTTLQSEMDGIASLRRELENAREKLQAMLRQQSEIDTARIVMAMFSNGRPVKIVGKGKMMKEVAAMDRGTYYLVKGELKNTKSGHEIAVDSVLAK